MLPCADTSLLALDCVLPLNSYGCPGSLLGKGHLFSTLTFPWWMSPAISSMCLLVWKVGALRQTKAMGFPMSSKSADHKAQALLWHCLLDGPLRFDETKKQQEREREKEMKKERG